jgi:perosamine synthetase
LQGAYPRGARPAPRACELRLANPPKPTPAMPFRTLPPAGTVILPGEFARWLPGLVRSAEANLDPFVTALSSRLGGGQVTLLGSGRAALFVAFEVLSMAAERGSGGPGPRRDEVLLPGYTCPSIVAAAHRAGLRTRPVDVDPRTLNFDQASLADADLARVLAIVSTSLFGIPEDLPFLESFARERGIALVDDAAQALGASRAGRPVGGFGSVGILSFERGKNLTTVRGGALICHDPALAPLVQARTAGLGPRVLPRRMLEAVELGLYGLFLHPRLYTLPDGLLSLGETTCDPDFPLATYSPGLAPMGSMLLERIDALAATRGERAGWYRDGLDAAGLGDRVLIPGSGETAAEPGPVYPRLPVLLPDRASRDRALGLLAKAGMGASRFYPAALVDFPPARRYLAADAPDTPNARALAARLLTLPTHGHVTRDDADRIVRILASVLGGEDEAMLLAARP